MTEIPILLSGYAAKQCARRVHNEWDPTIATSPWEVPADLQLRFDAGLAFEAKVFEVLEEVLGSSRLVNLSGIRGRELAINATTQSMDDGVEVILGGWLPDDVQGGRVGKPDVLLRHSLSDGVWRYVAGDVKGHKTAAKRSKGTLRYSAPSEPQRIVEAPGLGASTTTRLDDYLQLAHYWRMLEACNRAPDLSPTGFIIGTDQLIDLDPLGITLTWLDLAAPVFQTYSRSRGTAKRSAMERYDHELDFRLRVAAVAASRTGATTDPLPLVEPIFTVECDSCPWYDYCRSITDGDAASAAIRTGRLSVREWHALQSLGVATVEELAALDVDDDAFLERYLPEVTHQTDPLGRLRAAVRRATMLKNGVTIQRETRGPIPVPRADVEIDFDIEWDPDNHVYLWGALVTNQDGEVAYVPTFSWEILDDAAETELAHQFADWLRELIRAEQARGQTVVVYHYSSPELTHLRRNLGEEAVADLTDHFVDLLAIVRGHYFGLNGLGIKSVAPAFGFHWRDDDPGGLQSQLWLQEARAEDPSIADAARKRILEYNEDDVRATAALRQGLSVTA